AYSQPFTGDRTHVCVCPGSVATADEAARTSAERIERIAVNLIQVLAVLARGLRGRLAALTPASRHDLPSFAPVALASTWTICCAPSARASRQENSITWIGSTRAGWLARAFDDSAGADSRARRVRSSLAFSRRDS